MKGNVEFAFNGHHIKFTLDLDPTDRHHANLIEHMQHGTCYDEELAWLMIRVLKPGDLAIDVGANLGFFTLLMSQLVGETGRVLAFEPVAKNIELLRQHLVDNNMSANVFAYDNPLWKEEKLVEFHISSDDNGGSALWPPGKWWGNEQTRLNPQSTQVWAMTLDSVMLPEKRPKLIKIDTEGADQAILEGGLRMLRGKPEYIVTELNPFGMKQLGYSTESFRIFMKGFGYDLFFLHSSDLMPSYVPDNVKVVYPNGSLMKNAMFSTIEAVAKAWPEAVG